MNAKLMWLWLSLICGAGSSAYYKLLLKFNNIEEIFKAHESEYREIEGLSDEVIKRLDVKNTSDAEKVYGWCMRNNIGILTLDDSAYPSCLAQLRDAPAVLYYRGHFPDFNSNLGIAVVGTRKMTDYGRNAAYDISRGLAEGGAYVVSGAALGIDGVSLSAAIASGGITVAVLGCGINIAYPPEHTTLLGKVLERGAVITEYPPSSPPAGNHFPVRNRIISGLARGTVVIEADLKSGALITARHALYQGREIFAVPGQISGQSSGGTNQLIHDGARLVTCAADILEVFEFLYPHIVDIDAAHRYKGSSEQEIKNVISAMRISSREQQNKYYGHGTYGGKSKSNSNTRIVKNSNLSDKPDEKEKSEQIENKVPLPEIESKSIFKTSNNKIEELNLKTASEILKQSNVEEAENAPDDSIDTSGIPNSFDPQWLDEPDLAVYNALPKDVPFIPDEICQMGFPIQQVMSALTILEINGMAEAFPGGYYRKK